MKPLARLAPLALLALLAATPGLAGNKKKSKDAPAPAVATASATALHEQVQGEWTIVLSEQDRLQLQALEMAFRTPPATEAELRKAGLGDEEMFLVGMIQMAVAEDPEDPKVLEMKAMMADMSGAWLAVGPDTLKVTIGDNVQEARYTVSSSSADALTVITRENDGTETPATFSIDGAGQLTVTENAGTEGAKVTRFQRR